MRLLGDLRPPDDLRERLTNLLLVTDFRQLVEADPATDGLALHAAAMLAAHASSEEVYSRLERDSPQLAWLLSNRRHCPATQPGIVAFVWPP